MLNMNTPSPTNPVENNNLFGMTAMQNMTEAAAAPRMAPIPPQAQVPSPTPAPTTTTTNAFDDLFN